MGSPYSIKIRVSAYSGISREQAGPKEQSHVVDAECIDGALRGAKLIVRGLRMNPAAWQAEILSVTALRDDHEVVQTPFPEAFKAPMARTETPAALFKSPVVQSTGPAASVMVGGDG